MGAIERCLKIINGIPCAGPNSCPFLGLINRVDGTNLSQQQPTTIDPKLLSDCARKEDVLQRNEVLNEKIREKNQGESNPQQPEGHDNSPTLPIFVDPTPQKPPSSSPATTA